MKLLRLAAAAAVIALAACTSSPTNSAGTDATSPSLDGGSTLESGLHAGEGDPSGAESPSDGGNGLGSGNYAPADSTITGRGGNGLGSGN